MTGSRCVDAALARNQADAIAFLRAGQIRMGVEKLRSLLFADDGITRRVDLPTIYQAKFVVAILMDQNIEGAVYIVNAISDQKHPRVVELRQRIRNWQSSLTFLEKIGFKGRRPFDLADIAVDDFW